MKKHLFHGLCMIAVLSVSKPIFAQSEDELGAWYIYNGFYNFSPKFELFFESQLRTYEVASQKETFFVRPYFNYNWNKSLQTGLGLEYHSNSTFDDGTDPVIDTEEFRTTLQVMLYQKVGRASIQHRNRYEWRWLDGDALQRMRYRLMVTIPITNKTMEKGTFFANTFNEFMVDTNPEVKLNQSRLYFAGGYQFSKNLSFQFGYMNVYRTGSRHGRLQFFIIHKLWFYDRD